MLAGRTTAFSIMGFAISSECQSRNTTQGHNAIYFKGSVRITVDLQVKKGWIRLR